MMFGYPYATNPMIQFLDEILNFDNRNRSLGSLEGQSLEYVAGLSFFICT